MQQTGYRAGIQILIQTVSSLLKATVGWAFIKLSISDESSHLSSSPRSPSRNAIGSGFSFSHPRVPFRVPLEPLSALRCLGAPPGKSPGELLQHFGPTTSASPASLLEMQSQAHLPSQSLHLNLISGASQAQPGLRSMALDSSLVPQPSDLWGSACTVD